MIVFQRKYLLSRRLQGICIKHTLLEDQQHHIVERMKQKLRWHFEPEYLIQFYINEHEYVSFVGAEHDESYDFMVPVMIPEGVYAVFAYKGEESAVDDFYQEIYRQIESKADFDFEQWHSQGAIDIHIPLMPLEIEMPERMFSYDLLDGGLFD